jgi:hypothetical protein
MLWILDEVDGVIVAPASACDLASDLASDLGSDLARLCAKPQRLQLVGDSTFPRKRDASITMASHRDAQIHLGEMFRLFDQAVRPPAAKSVSQSAGSAPHACSAMRATAYQPWSLPAVESFPAGSISERPTEARAAEGKRLTD